MMSQLDHVGVIVFARLDRLSRHPTEGAEIVERCRAADVELWSCQAGKLDASSADDEFQLGLLLGLNRREVRVLQERTKRGVATARSKGHHVGGVPFGWRRGADKKLEPDPNQQAALRKAARVYVRGGSFAEAGAMLGLKRRDGGPAAPGVVRQILRSSRVQGALGKLGGELHDALLDRRMERGPRSNRSLLGGIARCAECGGGLRRSSTRAGRNGRWTQYRCSKPGHAGIAGPWLEEHVTDAALASIDLRGLQRRVRQQMAKPAAVEVIAIEARIEELEDAYGDGTLDKAAFTRQRARQTAKLHQARQAATEQEAIQVPLDLARRLREPGVWAQLTVPEQRRIIKALVREVRVAKANGHGPIDAGRVAIDWR
jgi:site-specific DNA recombinase